MGEDACARVLVVEDDASLNEIVCACLTQEGYACTPVFSGSEARLVLEQTALGRTQPARNDTTAPNVLSTDTPAGGAVDALSTGTGAAAPFDLIVTDLMLPGMPGEELVPFARGLMGPIPIIVTSAKGAVEDRVALLRTGADDYLVKPFDLDELVARVEALLRRSGHNAGRQPGADAPESKRRRDGSPAGPDTDAAEPALAYGAWRLSPARRTFSVNDAPVKLTRTEFDLLATLMAHPDRVFSKRELYALCCSDDPALEPTVSDEKTVVTHMGNLRAKLKPTGTESYLETVWGIGFKLCSGAAG